LLLPNPYGDLKMVYSERDATQKDTSSSAVTSSPGHTPGPWDINPMRTVDGQFIVCAGEGHGYGVVADVLAEADARLIAAAPDMLAALEAHQIWEKREKEGPLYPFGMKRDDPGGEQIWRAWWNDQIRICALSHELTDAAIAKIRSLPAI